MSGRPLQLDGGVMISVIEHGRGAPFFFQHGLGGTASQPLEVVPANVGFRCIVAESRGHGDSALGPRSAFGFSALVDDLAAVFVRLGIDRAVVGGISMGAAIALDFALRWPERVRALVIARPGFALGRPSPNLGVFNRVADLMRSFPADEARERLQCDEEFRAIESVSADNAQSLLGQFDAPDLQMRSFVLDSIAASRPSASPGDIEHLDCPALVIGNNEDAIHPLAYAYEIASHLANVRFRQITSKSISRERYVHEFRENLRVFLEDLE